MKWNEKKEKQQFEAMNTFLSETAIVRNNVWNNQCKFGSAKFKFVSNNHIFQTNQIIIVINKIIVPDIF